MSLNYLLKPRSVAVIGATDKKGFGRSTCLNLLKSNISDRLYFVNKKRDVLMGKNCYKSIFDIPEAIDLAIICTPKSTIKYILEDLGKAGCKAAVVYASGYSEVDKEGAQAEQELLEIARKYNMSVNGPNCAGFVNNVDNVLAFGLPTPDNPQKGQIGLLAQSGQVCLQLYGIESLSFSYLISTGNSRMIDTVDYLEFLVDDADTKVVALYLEGVKQPERFLKVLAKAAEIRKPIIVLKTGKSAKGKQIATAHTGSLAGSDATFDALFKKYGVIRVNDMEELANTINLFSTLQTFPKKAEFACMSLSGGETAITADMAEIKGLNIPDFEPDTLGQLKELLPDYATANNPLDMTATFGYNTVNFRKAVRAIMEAPNIGMVLLGLNIPQTITVDNKELMYNMCDGIIESVQSEYGKPAAIVSFLSGTPDSGIRKHCSDAGVPILTSLQYALLALKNLEQFINYNPELMMLKIPNISSNKETYEEIGVNSLSEHESKLVLEAHGITITKEYVVKSETELLDAVKSIGYPVVLKIDSPDVPHKTEAGAVKVNITNEGDLLKSYAKILNNVAKYKPDAKIKGVLVQEMLPKGMEAIVGVTKDEQFGPMVLVGLGGIYVEAFKDFALYPAPLNHYEARQMINSLKVAPLFKGYRGADKLDVEALADLIVSVGKLAADNEEIYELDINPLFVYAEGKGVGVADALVVVDALAEADNN